MVFIKMKKNFAIALLISIIPSLCFGASARYTQLVREKQRKYDELQKCLGATKGLKIAGVSTLGLTAIGVATDISQAGTKREYDKKIKDYDTKLETVQNKINEKKAKDAEKDANKDEQSNANNTNTDGTKKTFRDIVKEDIITIKASAGRMGDSAILHGYCPENILDSELKQQLEEAISYFKTSCEEYSAPDEYILKGGVSQYDCASSDPQYDNDYNLTDNTVNRILSCKAICVNDDYISNETNCFPKNTDCLATAQRFSDHVIKAQQDPGKPCEITECDTGWKPNICKTSCIEENVKEENDDCTTDDISRT